MHITLRGWLDRYVRVLAQEPANIFWHILLESGVANAEIHGVA